MKTKIFIAVVVFLFLIHCKGDSPTSPKVPSYPNITSFTATPSTIKRGTTSTLSWNVTNCTSVSIDQGIGTVQASGSTEVKPLEDITYTLTAINADGSSNRECSITVESGADVIMISGPLYKEDEWSFTYFGKVKNQGTYEASFVKVYIYLNDSNGNLVDYDWNFIDKTDLKPNEQSPWSWTWWDENRSLRNKIDKSKTEYDIEWSEYTWIVRTGRKSIYER